MCKLLIQMGMLFIRNIRGSLLARFKVLTTEILWFGSNHMSRWEAGRIVSEVLKTALSIFKDKAAQEIILLQL